MVLKTKDWIYKRFIENEMPHWKCPTCNLATLVLENQIIKRLTSIIQNFPTEIFNEKTGRDEQTWIDILPGLKDRFSAFLRCPNSSCREYVLISGTVNTGEYVYKHPEYGICEECTDFYYPKYFNPPIYIIEVNKKYPERVKDILVESFLLYWTDNSACANKIRTIVELILDEIKIKKKRLSKKRK